MKTSGLGIISVQRSLQWKWLSCHHLLPLTYLLALLLSGTPFSILGVTGSRGHCCGPVGLSISGNTWGHLISRSDAISMRLSVQLQCLAVTAEVLTNRGVRMDVFSGPWVPFIAWYLVLLHPARKM